MQASSRTPGVVVLCLSLLLPAAAAAQDEAAGMSAESISAGAGYSSEADATGVRVSDSLTFHPSAGVSTGYQTNVFRQDDQDGAGPLGAALMRIGVGASLETPKRRRSLLGGDGGARPAIGFNGNLNLTWHQYISGNDAVSNQSDLGVNGLLDLKVNPEGEFTFTVRDGFVRTVDPPQGVSGDNQEHDRNELMLEALFKPGGGALQGFLRYNFDIDFFEDARLSFANRQFHIFTLGGRWQWLPKTQFNLDVSYGFISPNDTAFKSASSPLRAWAGVSTLVTPRLGIVLRGGYANGFYDAGPSYSSYLAQVEGRYAVGPTVRTAFGYLHDFHDSVITNFYEEHKLYGRVSSQFSAQWDLAVRAHLALRRYDYLDAPGMPFEYNDTRFCTGGSAGCNTSDRTDLVLGLDAKLGYQINRWLQATLTYDVSTVTTDAFIQALSDGETDSAGYIWQEVMAGLTAKY